MRRHSSVFTPALCPMPSSVIARRRCAFAPPPSSHASPSAPIQSSLALQALTPAERMLQVFFATSSSMLNGGLFGAVFGFISGMWTHRGAFRLAATDAASNLRSWGAISAVYAGLQTASKVIRNKDDRINAVVGACGSGATFYVRSGPRAAVQGCVTFAALSYAIDAFVAPKEDPNTDEAILRKR